MFYSSIRKRTERNLQSLYRVNSSVGAFQKSKQEEFIDEKIPNKFVAIKRNMITENAAMLSYTTVPKPIKRNIQKMYSKEVPGKKTKHYEFVKVNRGGKVFYQYREVGKLVPTWVDTTQKQMIMNAGRLTEEDWNKKYKGHQHGDYKALHQSFMKFKEQKEKERNEQGIESPVKNPLRQVF